MSQRIFVIDKDLSRGTLIKFIVQNQNMANEPIEVNLISTYLDFTVLLSEAWSPMPNIIAMNLSDQNFDEIRMLQKIQEQFDYLGITDTSFILYSPFSEFFIKKLLNDYGVNRMKPYFFHEFNITKIANSILQLVADSNSIAARTNKPYIHQKSIAS